MHLALSYVDTFDKGKVTFGLSTVISEQFINDSVTGYCLTPLLIF